MARYTRIDFEKMLKDNLIDENRLQCAFVSIISRGKPYSKKLKETDATTEIPLVLMQHRWDQLIGFPGGKVDREDYINGELSIETLKNGLVRELKEEINLDNIDRNKLKLLCTHHDTFDNIYIHNFIYEVDLEEFYAIFKNTITSDGIGIENCGAIIGHLHHYKGDNGICNLLEQKFAATGKLELIRLLTYLGIDF